MASCQYKVIAHNHRKSHLYNWVVGNFVVEEIEMETILDYVFALLDSLKALRVLY
jgi:hypothetical protein